MKYRSVFDLWFSLIEVVVASLILTISVFWVYKLIGENNKLLNNSDNFLDANLLIENTINCIENIWFENFKSSIFNNQTWSFYIENSLTWKCLTWTYNPNYSFTWIKLNNKDYFLYWIITGSWNNYLDWNLWVYSDWAWKIEKTYRQSK